MRITKLALSACALMTLVHAANDQQENRREKLSCWEYTKEYFKGSDAANDPGNEGMPRNNFFRSLRFTNPMGRAWESGVTLAYCEAKSRYYQDLPACDRTVLEGFSAFFAWPAYLLYTSEAETYWKKEYSESR